MLPLPSSSSSCECRQRLSAALRSACMQPVPCSFLQHAGVEYLIICTLGLRPSSYVSGPSKSSCLFVFQLVLLPTVSATTIAGTTAAPSNPSSCSSCKQLSCKPPCLQESTAPADPTFSCASQVPSHLHDPHHDSRRPIYHPQSARGWSSDPCGPIFYKDRWVLCARAFGCHCVCRRWAIRVLLFGSHIGRCMHHWWRAATAMRHHRNLLFFHVSHAVVPTAPLTVLHCSAVPQVPPVLPAPAQQLPVVLGALLGPPSQR
jgi:hypothetical protein